MGAVLSQWHDRLLAYKSIAPRIPLLETARREENEEFSQLLRSAPHQPVLKFLTPDSVLHPGIREFHNGTAGDSWSRMNHSSFIERVTRLLDSSPNRWHRRIDEPRDLVFVLDDGTGDVELRFNAEGATTTAQLLFRGRTIDSFEAESMDRSQSHVWDQCLSDGIARGLRRLEQNDARPARGKSQSRFMVSFEPNQLDALRDLAAARGIPIAEVIREAVTQFLAGRETSR